MNIYIPKATGQDIPDAVLQGIDLQTIPCTPIVCATEGVVDSQRNPSPERVAGELSSRRLCQQRAAKDDDIVLMMDRDCVLTDPMAIADMVWDLRACPTVGAVALWFGRCPKITPKRNLHYMKHTVMKCALYRKEVFLNLDFRYLTETCTCNMVKAQIENMNYKYRYLDFKHRAFEIMY